jgi:flagellar biosynthetic protein FliQ
MTTDAVIRILREGLLLSLVLSAGPLAAALLTGLIASILQATTSLQEQTLAFVPKLLAVSLTLAILGPWMLNESVRFTSLMFDSVALIR